MDKIDMWIEMFGDNPVMRQAAGKMNPESVKEVYEFWLSVHKNSELALGYIMGKSSELR